MHAKVKRGPTRIAVAALVLTMLAGCAVSYNQQAYERALKTQNKTILLLDKAQEKDSAKANKDALENLRADYAKALQAEQARESALAKNTESINIWKRLTGMLQATFTLWEKQGKLSVTYINSKKKQIAESFKDLRELEKAKQGAPR